MLATSHDGDVKVWDQRKGNSPIQYIAAHLTKVKLKKIVQQIKIDYKNDTYYFLNFF